MVKTKIPNIFIFKFFGGNFSNFLLFIPKSKNREVKVEGIRRLEDLITSHNDCVAPELHIVVLALLEEVFKLNNN
jgi:hypothetical protein